jgi:hypothetical protein
MPVIQLAILESCWWLVDPHKSGWTEGSPETGHAWPFPKWEKWHKGKDFHPNKVLSSKDFHPNKVLSSQQDTDLLPIVAGRLCEHVKAPHSRWEIRERKQNFYYDYKAQSRCPAICFGLWATGIRLAWSVGFCLIGVCSRLSIVILQKRIVAQLVTKFLASYRTWRFTTII